MTHREFEEWVVFMRLYPFDDFHRFHRPAALVAQAMGGGSMRDKLEFLQPTPPDPALAGYSSADARTLAAFGITPPKRH
ncbi:phage tail assembly protein T [Lysobacter antibioticus]|uniref:phage tail assembly protein T n=1 Tax=Lysobacter antibioticus TaxID=84531 RepID=UPI0007E8CF28